MRLVWAIKDYLCLQGPDMSIAGHAGGAAAEPRMVAKQVYCLFDSHKVFATKPWSSYPRLVGICTCLWEAKSPPCASFHHLCLVLQDSPLGGGCRCECSQGGCPSSGEWDNAA